MESQPIPVAVIGVGGFGSLTLQALLKSPLVKVVGLSDRDSTLVANAAKSSGVPGYTDNRSLLAEARPRIVYLGVPPMAAPDLVAACAERGIHVWKELPLARNLPEALAMIRRTEQAGVKLAVGTQRRFARGYRRGWELRPELGHIFLARSLYLFNWGPKLDWRGDKSSAGGGALLELGYHLVDLMVWMLGLPEEVYGASAGQNRPELRGPDGKPLPIYDTDDTATAILRYGKGAMATLLTTRVSGPVLEELALHGRGGSLTASGEQCVRRDPDGNVLESLKDDDPPLEVFRRQAEAFALSVAGESPTYECSARENLLNLAVIEAIYLSDRTGQPESPRRLLKTNDITPEDCLIYRPPTAATPPPPACPDTAC